MANKRDIKKEIKSNTDQLIEDAFYQSLDADDKTVKSMDGIVDDIVDHRFDLLNRVANYPNKETRAKIKEHFNSIRTDLDKLTADFRKKIGTVG